MLKRTGVVQSFLKYSSSLTPQYTAEKYAVKRGDFGELTADDKSHLISLVNGKGILYYSYLRSEAKSAKRSFASNIIIYFLREASLRAFNFASLRWVLKFTFALTLAMIVYRGSIISFWNRLELLL
jgi:hypothetical protein